MYLLWAHPNGQSEMAVKVGEYPTKEAAEQAAKALRSELGESPSIYVLDVEANQESYY